MPKSAQQKFNEYLDESRETRNAINEVESSSRENCDGSYAFACGYFSALLGDIISELPKKRRAEIREQLLRTAQKQKNELLAKKIKDSDVQRVFDPAGVLR
jgi:hypothetical protein